MSGKFDPAALVQRIGNIIIEPSKEFAKISAEAPTVNQALGYATLLLMVPTISNALNLMLQNHGSAGSALVLTAFTYIGGLIGLALSSWIARVLARKFGGTPDRGGSYALTAYSWTPVWLAGVSVLLPKTARLINLAAAIYAIYLFYLGAPGLMKVPKEESVGYTVAVMAICFFIAMAIFGLIAAFFFFLFSGFNH